MSRVADFRSDTVTSPTARMYEAMLRAQVGDDAHGDDATVMELEERFAKLFNKESALFFPTGTMANQAAVASHTLPGDEILIDELDKKLGDQFRFNNLDRLFQVILKSATYELLYKPNVSIKIIIKEYLNASNFFLDNSQTKYLNALLDNIAKKIRINNA